MHPRCSPRHGVPHRTLVAFLALGLLALSTPGRAQDAAEDSSGDEVWQLDFEHEALRIYAPRTGPYKGNVYWYMLYTLKNDTGAERDIYVAIHAESDRDATYSDVLLPGVEKGIERKIGEERWGPTDRFEILSKRDVSDPGYHYTSIAAGESRKCVAVLGRLDPDANKIRIEVWGLSNELVEVEAEDGTTALQERVRVLEFKRLGDEFGIDQDSFELVRKSWVKKAVRI